MKTRNRMEKRNNVRANISAVVTVKLNRPEAAEAGSNALPDNPGSFSTAERPPALEKISDPLLSYLAEAVFLLNEKLDRIITMLGDDSRGHRPIRVKEAVDISGTGMKLILFDPVAAGQILDISLQLPGLPETGFNTSGEVIHTRSIPGEGRPLFEIGVNFIDLSEEEKDLLIAFAFSQQRQEIRKQKDNN